MSEESTEIVSSLSSLKKPAKKRTTRTKSASSSTAKKRTTKKKSTKAKSASSGATSTRRKSTQKGVTKKKPSTKRTTSKSSTSPRSKLTLRADLKKYAGESYSADDLISGVAAIMSRERTEILRDAVTAFLANKVPIMGEMLNDSLMDGLIGKLTDDYGKVKAAERKGIRAVINWLDGDFDPGGELESGLVSMLHNAPPPADEAPELSVSDFTAEPDTKPKLKPLR